MNDTVITSSAKKSDGPTSLAAFAMISQCGLRPPYRARCLCAFSTITIPASTIVPIATAIPPSDMMLSVSPCRCTTIIASRIPTGSAITATSPLRR